MTRGPAIGVHSPVARSAPSTMHEQADDQRSNRLASPALFNSINDEKSTGDNPQQQQPNPGPTPGKTGKKATHEYPLSKATQSPMPGDTPKGAYLRLFRVPRAL